MDSQQFITIWGITSSLPMKLQSFLSNLFCGEMRDSESFKVQIKCFFFIAQFERAAKIRKIAVYDFLISLLVSEL